MQTYHYLPRALPEKLKGLAILALDLRWSWNHGADALWRQVAPGLWDMTSNPWLILETVSDSRLRELAADDGFVDMLQKQLDMRKTHLAAGSWFSEQVGERFSGHIAYFSMEFGICESLPIYSGGLGVLAGDYLKTACDLNVPVVGIGLLYQQGYFRQALNHQGEQIEFYPYNDPTMLPVVPLRDANGEWLRVALTLPGRTLHLRTWRAQIGRRTLLLLDSNDPLNDPGDRAITSELYGGGEEVRLQQEMVLGIGGWRLIERLGIDCPVCHLNEGHAAFAVLERARHFMRRNRCSFDVALRATKVGNLFTTHTPVVAGFDSFSASLFNLYFGELATQLGISMDELMALGRLDRDDLDAPFNMAYLAVRGSGAVNGVSRLHGRVSQEIFQPLFPRWPRSEVPIGHITNGIHVPSWDSPAADTLWTQACGKARWRGTMDSIVENMQQLSDEQLWCFRTEGRHRLIDYLRRRLVRQYRGWGGSSEYGDILDPDCLTLGFARRFAEYKRPNLLLHDPYRLVRLLSNRDHPVQLVVAGKAHPDDSTGKAMVRQWHDFIENYGMQQHVIFVEDYDLGVAGQLTQGVDVWINTPRRPWEASGTSGMKVLVNGGLNLSELDGWWAEAYTADVGWAVGDGFEHADVAACDAHEAEQLYRLLENEVIPDFYCRNEHGLPLKWIRRMRESMVQLTARFSSNRMLREYTEKYYLPLAKAYRKRDVDSAMALQTWRQHLQQHWQQLHFGNVTISQKERQYRFDVQVYLGDIAADMVKVEIYAEAASGGEPLRQELTCSETLAGAVNACLYTGTVSADRPVSDYTPRIIAYHPEAVIPLECELIRWYR